MQIAPSEAIRETVRKVYGEIASKGQGSERA